MLYGGVLLAISMGGWTLYGVPYLGWTAAAVLVMAAGLALATVRGWGRRLPPAVVSAGLWTTVALALAGSVFVLLNLIELVVDGTVRDREGRPDWDGFGQRLGFAAVAALFLATALSWRHRTRSTCPRCGRAAHPPGSVAAVVRPAPPASGRIHRVARLGGLAVVPYYTCHLLRFADAPPFRGGDLAAPGDLFIPAFVIGTALPAEFLLQGLVREWGMIFPRWTLWLSGRRVPRFLPISPVWLIAPTLASYGTGAWIYLLLQFTGVLDMDGSAAEYLLGCSAATGFAGYGWSLAIAGVSYQRRTRPRCVQAGNPHLGDEHGRLS
ncbi:hypothetical protein [Actinomadura sp. 3N508]|uniref:hypothetical protein n=1 Tax=Actinomadura sp. 3N508 TaxID=3375153 RepID=UPI0037A36DB1